MEIITETKKTADLAKLSFTEKELSILECEMESILTFVQKASEVETTELSDTDEKKAFLREDLPQASFTKEELLANAPETYEGYIAVPRVID